MLVEGSVLCYGFILSCCMHYAGIFAKKVLRFIATCNYIRLWTNSQGSMVLMCKVYVRAFSNILSVIVIH